jgi:carbon storage regulator
MLVLTRRLHEKILLPGFNTAIQIIAIQSGSVRIGVEAPADVKVLREEVANEEFRSDTHMPRLELRRPPRQLNSVR